MKFGGFMAAVFLEEEKIFKLDTRNTTYVIAVVDDEQFLGHVYYGKKLKEVHLDGLLRIHENPFVPSRNNRDRLP